jgi:outer membrane protein OmpA-like peptidoglycan-associated protein
MSLGKRTLTSQLPAHAVQAKGAGTASAVAPSEDAIATRAGTGIVGAGGPVPHRELMERAFGVPLNGVRAHTDDKAAQACDAIGANAFAVGHDVAFGTPSPDVGLVAHELTHVVQQSGRVQPKMAVGTPGDAYEQEADAVADRVNTGQTVHDVTAAHLGSAGLDGRGAARAVQRDVISDLALGARNLCHNVAEGIGLETHDQAEAGRLEAFIAHGLFGPRDLVPPTNIGGFAASYEPTSNVLTIQVRTGINFVNGLTLAPGTGVITSNHTDLNQAAIDGNSAPVASRAGFVADFTWTRAQETAFIANLKARVEGAWSSGATGLSFTCTRPGWESLTATAHVDVDVHHGAATGTDHLESTVYKVPDSGQYTITSAVDGNRNDPNVAFDNDPHNNGVEMSSTDVASTPITNSLLRKSVTFAHDSAVLDATGQATVNAFTADFQDANLDLTNPVTLEGHASSSGSDDYNRALAQRRIDAVTAQLGTAGFTGLNDRVTVDNQGETGAAEAPEWRRVDLICGTGEGQAVASHEFGHVFGLLDEYAINPGGTIQGTGNPTGTVVGHDAMARAIGAGGAVSENNDGVMPLGNAVRPQHYATFGWALMQVTGVNQWQVGRPAA